MTIRTQALGAMITMFLVLSIVFMLMRLLPVETYYGGRSDSMSEAVKEQILSLLACWTPCPSSCGGSGANS